MLGHDGSRWRRFTGRQSREHRPESTADSIGRPRPARFVGLDSRQLSHGSLMLPLGQRLVDLEHFRDVFERFDERRNLPRIAIHRVLASIESGERETHVLAKPID